MDTWRGKITRLSAWLLRALTIRCLQDLHVSCHRFPQGYLLVRNSPPTPTYGVRRHSIRGHAMAKGLDRTHLPKWRSLRGLRRCAPRRHPPRLCHPQLDVFFFFFCRYAWPFLPRPLLELSTGRKAIYGRKGLSAKTTCGEEPNRTVKPSLVLIISFYTPLRSFCLLPVVFGTKSSCNHPTSPTPCFPLLFCFLFCFFVHILHQQNRLFLLPFYQLLCDSSLPNERT